MGWGVVGCCGVFFFVCGESEVMGVDIGKC